MLSQSQKGVQIEKCFCIFCSIWAYLASLVSISLASVLLSYLVASVLAAIGLNSCSMICAWALLIFKIKLYYLVIFHLQRVHL
jgi:hypothetical protein